MNTRLEELKGAVEEKEKEATDTICNHNLLTVVDDICDITGKNEIVIDGFTFHRIPAMARHNSTYYEIFQHTKISGKSILVMAVGGRGTITRFHEGPWIGKVVKIHQAMVNEQNAIDESKGIAALEKRLLDLTPIAAEEKED